MNNFLQSWWSQNRYKEVLHVCLPLVLGMSATTIMEFTDRIFLANYSVDALAAALPAGISAFLFMAFFGGIGGYSSVFIAQYFGRGENNKIGVVLWQGIYFTVISGVILWIIAVFSGPVLFKLFGHPIEVQVLEEKYYVILCKGAVFHVALSTLSAFFSGRGLTRPVMIAYFLGMIINIPLDYSLIYGKVGLPEMGIAGAAIATVVASLVPASFLGVMIFIDKHNQQFGIKRHYHFDNEVFFRIVRFGAPGALQFTIDIFAFTVFSLLVGKLGTIAMAATTIVLSINSIAFMPSMGVSQGVSILVGQDLGKGLRRDAKNVTWSAGHLLLLYIICIDFLFLFFPDLFLNFFISIENVADTEQLTDTCIILLRIVSAYLFFDSLYMVFTGALKGAGDNMFIMLCVGMASLVCLIIPCYVGIEYFDMGVYFAWSCILVFIGALFVVSAFRFFQGKWQDMLVIEPHMMENSMFTSEMKKGE